MTLTTKPTSTTLSFAEQIELRRFMNNPDSEIAVMEGSIGISNILMKSLAAKGYIVKIRTEKGFDFYKLKIEEV